MSKGRVWQLPDSAVLLSFGRPDWQSGPTFLKYLCLELGPHLKSLLTADYADNTDKYQNICDQMVKHYYETCKIRES